MFFLIHEGHQSYMVNHHLLASIRAIKLGLLLTVNGALVLNGSGCASVGQNFAASRVMEIKIGQTTQRDIREIFGEPWRVGIEDGNKTWTYGKYKYSLFGSDETEDLVIRFDTNGIVRSYTFNTTRK
ncbi:MAG: outer membrane protein assembly factor BamE domain-containing protein [Gammaproteobacteria bacterium]